MGDSPLMLVLLVALFVAIALLSRLDEGADLRAHAQWEADLKERGAWVMW